MKMYRVSVLDSSIEEYEVDGFTRAVVWINGTSYPPYPEFSAAPRTKFGQAVFVHHLDHSLPGQTHEQG